MAGPAIAWKFRRGIMNVVHAPGQVRCDSCSMATQAASDLFTFNGHMIFGKHRPEVLMAARTAFTDIFCLAKSTRLNKDNHSHDQGKTELYTMNRLTSSSLPLQYLWNFCCAVVRWLIVSYMYFKFPFFPLCILSQRIFPLKGTKTPTGNTLKYQSLFGTCLILFLIRYCFLTEKI